MAMMIWLFPSSVSHPPRGRRSRGRRGRAAQQPFDASVLALLLAQPGDLPEIASCDLAPLEMWEPHLLLPAAGRAAEKEAGAGSSPVEVEAAKDPPPGPSARIGIARVRRRGRERSVTPVMISRSSARS